MVNNIRLYIDEDASRNSFVLALRNLEFDVVTTSEAENLGLADPEQLIWVAKNHRAIYTFNVNPLLSLSEIY